jgi:hypothetical protein
LPAHALGKIYCFGVALSVEPVVFFLLVVFLACFLVVVLDLAVLSEGAGVAGAWAAKVSGTATAVNRIASKLFFILFSPDRLYLSRQVYVALLAK